jgi:Sulfotransferase domain
MSRVAPQLICFSYHKTGTSLLLHVMTKVSQRLGRSLVNHYGLVDQLAVEPDIVLLPHSMLRAPLDRPYKAIRVIRDPRDMWLSAYLYHKHCDEGWCRNTNFDPTPPIMWPRVDYSFANRPEAWKLQYLERMGGKSYQQNLLDRSMADGLAFELEGYTSCTLETMRQWELNSAEALDIRLEDVMADFDGSMLRVFEYFGFSAVEREAALDVARTEDVRRMNDDAIARRPQIHSRTISKWRTFLSPTQVAQFEARHGDLIRDLGYALESAAIVAPTTPSGVAIRA